MQGASDRRFWEIALDSIQDIVYVLGIPENGKLVLWNKRLREVTGYSDEELSNMTVFDFFDDKGKQRQAEFLAELLEAGQASIEIETFTRNGAALRYEFKSTVVKDPVSGDPVAVVGVGRDVSEKKREMDERETLIHDLTERTKELRVLSDLSSLIDTPGLGVEGMLKDAAKIATRGWHYPEITAVRITYDDLEFIEGNWKNVKAKQAADLVVRGEKRGTVSVGYTEEKPDEHEGPFLAEERHLLDALAGRVGGGAEMIEARGSVAESEEKYRTLAETLPQAVFEYNWEGAFLYANRAGFEMFGYGQDEMGKVKVMDLIDPSDHENVARAITKMLDGRSDGAVREYLFRRKDGSTFPGRAYTTLISGDNGERAGVRGIMTDITEERESERAVRESEERYRDLFENANDMIQSVGPDLRFIYVNRAWKDTLGYSDEEVKDLRLTDIIHPDNREQFMGAFKETMSNCKELERVEAVFITKNGKSVPVEGNVNCSSRDGFPAATRGIFRDVSERNEWEEKLKRANVELRGYAHTVSHDLKSPITSLSLALDLIREMLGKEAAGRHGPEIFETIEIAERGLGRANNLINDLLMLAEEGGPRDCYPVSVNEKVKEIVAENKTRISKESVKVIPDADLGEVFANPTHMYQLFANLIKNSLAYNDSEDPVIEIKKLPGEGGAHRFLIRDNGPGISDDIIKSIFVPFTRTGDGGTGLGLAIVEKIVKAYGGEIKAFNDNGACFEFTLEDHVTS